MKQYRYKGTKVVWFHLCEVPRTGTFIETENRMEVSRGWQTGNEEFSFNEYKIAAQTHERVLEMNSDDGCTTF